MVQAAGYAYFVNWGDGQSTTLDAGTSSSTSLDHVYSSPGNFTVTLTATDENGLTSQASTATVAVSSYQLQGTTLSVGGNAGNDTVILTPVAGQVSVQLNGTTLGQFTATEMDLYLGGQVNDTAEILGTSGADNYELGNDTVTLTPAGSSAIVFTGQGTVSNIQCLAGAGNDSFQLDPDATPGLYFLDGQAGNDTVHGPDKASAWTLSGKGGTVNGVAFNNMEAVVGGAGDDTFALTANSALSINGGGGTNTLDYSLYGHAVSVTPSAGTASLISSIANIEALVGSAAGTTIVGPNTTNIWTLTGNEAGDLNGTFTFSNVNYLSGGSGIDTVVGPASNNSWVMTNYNLGTLNGVLTFNKMENLVGDSGNDSFQIQPNGYLTGTIEGGGGTNTLDYSVIGTSVGYHLSTGAAYSVAGGALNIQVLIGSPAGTRLYGPNTTTAWTLTAAGAGNLNGTFTFSGVSSLNGGTGTNTIIGSAGTNSWVLTGNDAGTLGTVTFANMANLTGGSGNNSFQIKSSGYLTGAINGGGGINTLDYSVIGTEPSGTTLAREPPTPSPAAP